MFMNFNGIYTIIGALCFIYFVNSPYAQEEPTDAQKASDKVVKVCTLNSVEANQEFQSNVQLVRLQREKVIELQSKLETINDEDEKKAIQTELDEMLTKLSENNEMMFNTYGFSLTRNYTMVIEKSHVYMIVSEEEAKQFEQEQNKTEENK